jgi:hypothetical protein
MNDQVTPKDAVIFLMDGAVPERREEIASLWRQDPADVIMVPDAKRVTLNANKDRIEFDAKTTDVFWLIGFAAWKAIECYMPPATTIRCRPVGDRPRDRESAVGS